MNTTSNVTAHDGNQHTTLTVPENAVLALLGDNGENWSKGSWGDDQQMCLHEAIRHCSPQPGDAFLIEQVARRQGWGPSWNDDETTSWFDVRARISHIEVTDADLADTFGPQWAEIVTLVRRAAALTVEEAEKLNAAWHATQNVTRTASWAATWTDAWHAAREAAWAAARTAAWDAAGALAVRDLIGRHGFTQEHYDALTEAWVTVIGPAHPDDEIRSR